MLLCGLLVGCWQGPGASKNGLPGPLGHVYTDLGLAPAQTPMRGLVALPVRNAAVLSQTIAALYTPETAGFRRYLTADQWVAQFAPSQADTDAVVSWLQSGGLEVPQVASNRLLVELTGTVGQFNRLFDVELHLLERSATNNASAPHQVLGLEGSLTVPPGLEDKIEAVVAADLLDPSAEPPPDDGSAEVAPPDDLEAAQTPAFVVERSGLGTLGARGVTGLGTRLGVVVGGAVRPSDLQAFWGLFGIDRAPPRFVQTMEPPGDRFIEPALDLEWAGAIAPGAELVVYQGPDARNTSMLYTFNEAIARGEVSVVTDSFAHREDSEPGAVRRQYSWAAQMAAALGITVVSASGDSSGVDVPGCSPYVTAVGGTRSVWDGEHAHEEAWEYSGSGPSLEFETPWWQTGLPGLGGRRGVVDVSVNGEEDYWTVYAGQLERHSGTSYSAPVFAAVIAVVNDARAREGKPVAGYLNPLLYTNAAVQASFADITAGGTPAHSAGPGWDFPSGWGTPNGDALGHVLP